MIAQLPTPPSDEPEWWLIWTMIGGFISITVSIGAVTRWGVLLCLRLAFGEKMDGESGALGRLVKAVEFHGEKLNAIDESMASIAEGHQNIAKGQEDTLVELRRHAKILKEIAEKTG